MVVTRVPWFDSCTFGVPLRSSEFYYLAAADAFRSLHLDRRQALWKLQAIVRDPDDLHAGRALPETKVDFPPPSAREAVATDYRVVGVSTLAHPVALLREEVTRYGATPARDLTSLPPGRRTRAAGLVIVRQSPPTANGMVFVTLEDETGFVNTAIPPRDYDRLKSVIRSPFLLMEGVLQREGLAVSLLISNAWSLNFDTGGFPDWAHNFH